MAVFIPADGEQFATEVAILIDLADHPRDVATTTDYERLAVVVPDELLERYHLYKQLESSSPVEPKKGTRKR